MVRRMMTMVYREVRGLHQAAYVLALFAFGSQLLALVRDRLLAHQFGAGEMLDVYYAAFRLPDLLFVVFASTLSVYVLIPFIARERETGGEEAASNLLSQVFSLFVIVYLIAGAITFIFAPTILAWFFPGIADMDTLVLISRILLIQPLWLGISSIFGVITQLGHRFVLYAISPLIYNLGIIFGLVFLFPHFGLAGLAIGVVLGAFGHMVIQWPLIRSSKLSLKWTRHISIKKISSILFLSIPRTLTLSLNQIVLLVLVSFASTMQAGSVSVFQFAWNLQAVPLSIIGVSYSVAAFPVLAEFHASKNMESFINHITSALRHMIFWSLPAIALIIVLRAQIVRVVLGSGAFDWSDTRLTAAVLALLVLSLTAQAVSLLVVRALYAGGHTRSPFIVTLFGSSLALVSSYVFYQVYVSNETSQYIIGAFMRLNNVTGGEVLAIAFGYTVAVIIQSIVLLWVLTRTYNFSLWPLWRYLVRAFTAASFGGIAAYVTLNFLVQGVNTDTFVGIFVQGLLGGVVGVCGIILAYAGLRSPELHEIYISFQRRLLKTDVIAPQEDVI